MRHSMQFAVLGLALLLGCGGDSTGPGASVVGTWHLQTIDGTQLPYAAVIDGIPVTITGDVLTISSNGTYADKTSVTSGSNTATHTESGRWLLDGNTVTFTDQTDGVLYEGTVDGSTLTEDISGSIQVYTR